MTEYAFMVFNGEGVPKDEVKGAELFRQAALFGNPIAQNRYSFLLVNGRGVKKDPVVAMAWHLYARVQGDSDPILDKTFSELPQKDQDTAKKIMQAWVARTPLPHT